MGKISVSYSSPGKIHFLGEHSVVHGKPALLAATNLRVFVTVKSAELRVKNEGSSRLHSNKNYPGNITQNLLRLSKAPLLNKVSEAHGEVPYDSSEDVKKLRETVEAVIIKKFKLKRLPAYTASIESKIPIGAGLGSSAASSAAYLAALLDFLKIKPTLELVNELAYECDKVFNGNPSGGDNTTVVYGGFIWYRKELDFLKTFQKLPFKLHKNIKQFFLIDSGKPAETTGELVAMVRDKLNKENNQKPQPRLSLSSSSPHTQSSSNLIGGSINRFPIKPGMMIKGIFDHQEQLVKDLALSLKEGDEGEIIKIIQAGEKNLERLGVVGKIAKDMIRKVEKINGAAKIIGGGGIKKGSGMLLAYHKNPNKLLNFTKKMGWTIIPIKLGGEGLRRENV